LREAVKLRYSEKRYTDIATSRHFREAAQIVLEYSFENKTFNKNRINKGTYRKVRERFLHYHLHILS